LILFNADHEQEIPFALPELPDGTSWELLFDTAIEATNAISDSEEKKEAVATDPYKLAACSMVVFRAPAAEQQQEAALA
jgi:hypothetical protein